MNLSPSLDEPSLPLRQMASDQFEPVDRENADIVLIMGVDMCPMVRRRRLGVHADDDTEEPRDFWHRHAT